MCNSPASCDGTGGTVRFAGAPTALCMLKNRILRSRREARFRRARQREDVTMPLSCKSCGSRLFSLRPAAEGAEAECFDCGTVIPNAALRGANPEAFILPAASMSPVSASETVRTGTPAI
jgi:hypothetical protein